MSSLAKCAMCLVFLHVALQWTTAFLLNENAGISVGSFNVRWFNPAKSEDSNVIHTLSLIINRYDVMAMLEIRDDDQLTAMTRLWSAVNATNPYGLAMSKPLGRYPGFYSERYAFFYRPDRVILKDTFQYDDSQNGDTFEREPFSTLFQNLDDSSARNIAYMVSHIQPKNAVAELKELAAVAKLVQIYWNTSRLVILGDLNADCNFISDMELSQTPLRMNKNFTWLISDDADTNVYTHTACAYDRIIVSNSVAHGNASVFYFNQAYNLNYNQTAAVSDHFPVEVDHIRAF